METHDYYIYIDLFSEFKPTSSNIKYFNQNAKKSMRNSDSNLKVAEKDIHEKIADIYVLIIQGFFNFSLKLKLAKIRQHGWKERLKISENATFEN